MMILLSAIALIAHGQIKWPQASYDNGFSYYLAAARLAETPDWKGFRGVRLYKQKLAILRQESARTEGILFDLKKGN